MTSRRSIARSLRRAYTLIEALAASAIIAVAVGAAASISASVSLQEDHARRVAVTRNFQENVARLWQLGLSRNAIYDDVLPDIQYNPILRDALFAAPEIIELGTQTLGSGPNQVTVETALCRATVNIGIRSADRQPGASFEMMLCRPTIK